MRRRTDTDDFRPVNNNTFQTITAAADAIATVDHRFPRATAVQVLLLYSIVRINSPSIQIIHLVFLEFSVGYLWIDNIDLVFGNYYSFLIPLGIRMYCSCFSMDEMIL